MKNKCLEKLYFEVKMKSSLENVVSSFLITVISKLFKVSNGFLAWNDFSNTWEEENGFVFPFCATSTLDSALDFSLQKSLHV